MITPLNLPHFDDEWHWAKKTHSSKMDLMVRESKREREGGGVEKHKEGWVREGGEGRWRCVCVCVWVVTVQAPV